MGSQAQRTGESQASNSEYLVIVTCNTLMREAITEDVYNFLMHFKISASNKFYVVFGVGDKKYSTGVAVDPAGCPSWNETYDM